MTATLLLRLEGPMQSWGTQSRFRLRDAGREPSKSGVIGLLCAALGLPRDTPAAQVAELAALHMGVRVDREGVVREDYQTAGAGKWLNGRYGVARAENPGVETAISRRAYLADASFLVGLQARTPDEEALLQRLNAALLAPTWPLYLGRKGYVPSTSVRLPDAPEHGGPGLVPLPLPQALQQAPLSRARADNRANERLRCVIEVEPTDPDAELRPDQPVSFASDRRVFASRTVKVTFLETAPRTS